MPRTCGMTRLLTAGLLATALLVPASAGANAGRSQRPRALETVRRQASVAVAKVRLATQRPSTNPVALSLKLAERYWHGVPACGTPTIVTAAHQLPNSEYESTTGPEPSNSVVEMWTEVQKCTITINASIWTGWQQDDESFQWFCDAMTHEVGHLFGQLDGGQTNRSSITYPFLSEASPNFNAVPECKDVALRYGSEEIRNGQTHRRSQH
jgi:hypothetical protein